MPTARAMLKVVLVVVGLLVFLAVGFFVWLARHPIVFTAPVSTRLAAVASRDNAGHAIRCVLHLTDSSEPYMVTEIDIQREWVQALGASPPSGFTEQPLAAEKNADDRAFVEKFNRETVRWVGQLFLQSERDVVLSIPAKQPEAGTGTIRFQYEHRGKFGGSIRFAEAQLEKH